MPHYEMDNWRTYDTYPKNSPILQGFRSSADSLSTIGHPGLTLPLSPPGLPASKTAQRFLFRRPPPRVSNYDSDTNPIPGIPNPITFPTCDPKFSSNYDDTALILCRTRAKKQEFILFSVVDSVLPDASILLVLDRNGRHFISDSDPDDLQHIVSRWVCNPGLFASIVNRTPSSGRLYISDIQEQVFLSHTGVDCYDVLEELDVLLAPELSFDRLITLSSDSPKRHSGSSVTTSSDDWYPRAIWRALLLLSSASNNEPMFMSPQSGSPWVGNTSPEATLVGHDDFSKRYPTLIVDQETYRLPRNRGIFPPTLGITVQDKKTADPPLQYTFPQLMAKFQPLHQGEDHISDIFVFSASYCKQLNDAKHEFLLLEVRDPKIPEISNLLILDRTVLKYMFIGSTESRSISSEGRANDRLRVSSYGSKELLTEQCSIGPYEALEHFVFPSSASPFLLSDLVIIALETSNTRVEYNLIKAQCFWFASCVWECMRSLNPSVYWARVAQDNSRGKFGRVFKQAVDQAELGKLMSGVKDRIHKFQETLNQCQKRVISSVSNRK
ncbi:hypothetical protein BDV93DRAFT_510686 [Ceratobasidium sp. AG-I]|nr:hypothetical protein BDV93DRAFT_510686 [Ceratobasidium sp. AG-I]